MLGSMAPPPEREQPPPLRALLFKRSQPGVLSWIGLRPAREAPMQRCTQARLIEARGIEGDIATKHPAGKRQVSLIQAEHLPVIAQLLQREAIDPALLRRNLVVSGINLLALRSTRFRIGSVLLQGTGTCEPCSKMERALGLGGYNALRGHGGILASVVQGGTIAIGDAVDFELSDDDAAVR